MRATAGANSLDEKNDSNGAKQHVHVFHKHHPMLQLQADLNNFKHMLSNLKQLFSLEKGA